MPVSSTLSSSGTLASIFCWSASGGYGASVRVRRTGTSVAILGAERANGALPEGVNRAASLEDVFVVLTGEEIE